MIEISKLVLYGINAFEYAYLYHKAVDSNFPVMELPEVIQSLISKEYLSQTRELTNKAYKIFPKERNYSELAINLRELFPKGKKSGRHPWRCTVDALITRLKSVDRQGMKTYSNEEVLSVAKGYVNSFNDFNRDNEMMLCMYFVLKVSNSTLLSLLDNGEEQEDTSSDKFRMIL